MTGGVRSGKSRWAQAEALSLGGSDVTVVATAEAIDEEMERRISVHRRERPEGWLTIEAPLRAGDAIRSAQSETILLDCLTVLAGNAMGSIRAESEEAALSVVAEEVDGLLEAIESREGRLLVVTNEVGWSVHPPTALGRWYQDALGAANQRLASVADRVVLMVAGCPVGIR
ncbi:MAG: bifunctional adenosylcobinamide kinase/adenosylcobinamide-phosphate guanylyltransferase [Gemmatimonadota bacterium]